jgi:hypothetical protein
MHTLVLKRGVREDIQLHSKKKKKSTTKYHFLPIRLAQFHKSHDTEVARKQALGGSANWNIQ